MDEAEEIRNLGETPHCNKINLSDGCSHDTLDSGYLTLTPHCGTYTPVTTGCRTRTSGCSKRYHRTRLDPLQSDRAQRHRSKLTTLLNASESDYLISENSSQSSSIPLESSDLSSSNHQSFSLEHHSPSIVNQSLESGCRDYRSALRSRARGRNWSNAPTTTTVPITPASSKLQLLSPPLSPAVPSSSFTACEPIEEDVEMKLVIVPQSTPHLTTSTSHRSSIPCIAISPAGRNPSPPIITSAENQKLSQLSITDLATFADIKPKRLDFSHRALSVALHRTRATPDYTGRENVDLLAVLGEKSNHWRIVSKILAFLGPQDLCVISMVSNVWRRICASDSRANMRRLSHIILRQNAKENLKLIKKAKMESEASTSPKSRYARKGYLIEVQNLLQVPSQQRPPSSPPVSPSKVKFHSFVKASRTLAPWEHLLPCPKCSFPCHVDGEKNVGTCSRQGCSMEFCTSCSSRPHTGPCKTPLLATPTKRNKRLIVGSRQSKRNLRRL